MTSSNDILNSYVHFQDGGKGEVIPVSASFWGDLAAGKFPQLDQGRLMTAFSFSESWTTWERHPAGEELVMLLSGEVIVVLEQADQEHPIRLTRPGEYILIPPNTWHTARTSEPATMLFLTPGQGTEHRPC